MVFSSLEFILIFMPIFFGCYYLVPASAKNIILLLGSLAFYLIGTINNPEHFMLLIVSIIVDYMLGIYMERRPMHKGKLLVLGICYHIISLGTFKYLGFIAGEIGHFVPGLTWAQNIVLPIGISFYTFQGLSYVADVYRGKVNAEKSLLKFAAYISMFEQLIAGPIVTYDRVKNELNCREVFLAEVLKGLATFVFGLGLKVLLANPIGKLWMQVCAIGFESISTPLAWMGVFAFSLQLYFDFFGYSLMAIGLGQMMGFKLPKNFDHPYISCTMTEFWRRWHITLGEWFKEYVYIPLGGNRDGALSTVNNLLFVWLLTGIWHGAGYNFILWGILLFGIIILEKFVIGDFLNRVPVIGHAYMIVLIPTTWAVFAVESMDKLEALFMRMFPFFGESMWSVFQFDYVKYWNIYWPFFIAGVLFSTKLPYEIYRKIKSPKIIVVASAIIFVACLYCIFKGFDDPFLYFRF